MDNDNREIFAPEVLPDGQYGERYSFFENDLVCIERWMPKSNYEIPFFVKVITQPPQRTGNSLTDFPIFLALTLGI